MKSKYNFLNQPRPHLIAHRGGNKLGVQRQNTLAAFQSAIDLGYKYIETDVLLTKDGKVIIYHGSRNRRQQLRSSQKRRKVIQNMTYSQVKSYIQPGGEKVPLLSEALAMFPQAFFNIDAKTKEVIEPLAGVIKKSKSIDRVCIASFSYKRTLGVAELLGGQEKVCTSIGPVGFGAYFFHARMKKAFKDKIGSLKIGCLQIPHRFVSKNLLHVAHDNGIMVHVWTVNRERQMSLMLDLGVDGIVTDETELLKNLSN